MPHPGYLYLPMEIAVRELDSRLLIALVAVERGMEVIMGQKWLMEKNIAAMPPGLVIFKTMTRRDGRNMVRAKRAGHMVASIDEEVVAFAEGSNNLHWVSEHAAHQCDLLFCLGEEHRKSLATRWPDIASRLIITGNPRWDYLRPDMASLYAARAAEYRARHGRIILINTNAGNANPVRGRPEERFRRLVRSGELDPNSPKDMAYWKDLWNFDSTNLRAIPQLARRLAREFPDHTVVIRPHPSERFETYSEQLADEPRVKVIFEGAASPWSAASEVLIHTYCTTGIEAFALGVPTICYKTTESMFNTVLLAGRLGVTVESEDAVVAEVRRILGRPPGEPVYSAAMMEDFARFFAARDGLLAAERVVEAAMAALGVTGEEGRHLTTPSWQPSLFYRRNWPSKAFRKRLFPPMDLKAIEDRLRALAGALGRSEIPHFVPCGNNVLHLYSPRLAKPKPIGNVLQRAIASLAG